MPLKATEWAIYYEWEDKNCSGAGVIRYDEQHQLWCVEVVCTDCYVSGPSATLCDQGDLHKIAVEKWNKRGTK